MSHQKKPLLEYIYLIGKWVVIWWCLLEIIDNQVLPLEIKILQLEGKILQLEGKILDIQIKLCKEAEGE